MTQPSKQQLQQLIDEEFNKCNNKTPFIYQLLNDSVHAVMAGKITLDEWEKVVCNICNSNISTDELKKLFNTIT